MISTLRSIMVLSLTWLYMLAVGLVALPWTLATRRLGFLYAVGRGGIRLLLGLAGVRVVVHGGENLAATAAGEAAALFMANHQSNLDPPLLVLHLPGHIAFLPKRELFRAPPLGTVLRAAGFIPVDRGDRAAARASLAQAAASLRAGRPFLIFPEGTRASAGELLPFKKGPFFLAEEAGVSVVPVTIAGSGALLPRGEWRIRPGVVHLYVHPPVRPRDWQDATEPRDEISRLVRESMEPAMSRAANKDISYPKASQLR